MPHTRAGTLADACGALVEQLRIRTRFERVAVVAVFEDFAHAEASGLARSELAELVEFAREVASGESAGVWPRVPISLSDLGLRRSVAIQGWALVPFPSDQPGFVACVVVDGHPQHPDVDEVGDCIRGAVAAILRCGEIEALRERVQGLETQRGRAARVLDTLPDPVLVMDAESRILLANRLAEGLFVASEEDNPGRRHAVESNNLFFSAFRARAMLGAEFEGGQRELLMVDPSDGSDLLFEVFFSPFATPGAFAADSMIYILRDITDLKRVTMELETQFSRSLAAEHQSRRESERLNVIIENAGVPILVTDHQANIVLLNREAERLFEVSAQRVEPSHRIQSVRANDTKLTGLINDFLLQSQRRRQEQLTLVDPERALEFPAEALITKILDRRGEATAVVTVFHDLTQEVENRRLATELRQLNDELEERIAAATRELAERNAQLEKQRAELERASTLKSEFLATMSHELRTPINSILGYNSLMREGIFGGLSDRQLDALERTRKSAEHLLSLINDILDLSKVEAGKMALEPVEITAQEFVDGLSEVVEPMAAAKSLAYGVEVQATLPPLFIDATRLRQVALNLLSNAVKFTHEGSITLRFLGGNGGRSVVMEVEDTGIGISAEHLDHIFEEFRQVDEFMTRQHGGTGLGLAISRKLVTLMGGQLTVTSELGVGSVFRADLPLVQAPRAQAPGTPTAATQRTLRA